MRPARLPAACTLLVLTAGPVALGTVPALAADSSPTSAPSATSATPSLTPSVTPSAPTPSATTGPTDAPSGSAAPTATPSATPTGASSAAECPEGPMAVTMPVTGSSTTPGQLAVTFDNISTTTVKELATTVALADGGSALSAELRAPEGAWKPLTVSGAPTNAGTYQLAPGQKLTLQLRATGLGDHRLTFTAKSEVLPSGSAPAKKYTCPQLTAAFTYAATNRTPTTPPADPAHLADTGAGTASRPLAIAGTTAVLLGATLVFLTRRRPTED
ncbi:LPXTG cell wall anchor domain-containing protein [Kitasatospora sp. NPDC101155]|uniref:LPXTG cell wall anchor domain-containing protein n=1 Tax=Kitasatospora sp. NPDC101155 TaxID=3364097 RepID=UPI003802E986